MNMLGTPAFETLTFLGRHFRNSYYVRELAKYEVVKDYTGLLNEVMR
ncbi:MAG: hypothetical protein WC406_09735 [Methanoregula sp.]